MAKFKPLLLVILDGFGISLETGGNPVAEAKKPNLDMLVRNFPLTAIQASGTAVGLPWGEAGNSEVGHLTMGSGRVFYHHLPRIINSISDGTFFKNEILLKAAEHVRRNKSKLHIAGLISSGSVHSYVDHLYALLEFTSRENISPVFLHPFTDGKDAPPREAADFLEKLEEKIKKDWPNVMVSSVAGRFYGLDRDGKWERTQTAYALLTKGEGEKINSIPEHIKKCYTENLSDEFIKPAVKTDSAGNVLGLLERGDALIFSDFREDSMRQIARSFADEPFSGFTRSPLPDLFVATLTEYQKGLSAHPIFPQLEVNWVLSQTLSDAKLTHLHIAETQKYAHVTYFFNGGREEPFPGEERILIPSITDKYFDEAPEMRAREITAGVLDGFEKFDVVIANFANADMVGHSGNYQASVQAVEYLDEVVGKLTERILRDEGVMLITGDHGNIERKRSQVSGEKLTEHSTNPVYFVLVGRDFKLSRTRTEEELNQKFKDVGGILTDIAPTILDLLKIHKPQEMTGASLLPKLLEPT